MIIKESELYSICFNILTNYGSDPGEAELVARHLVRADLTGHSSHGAGMLPTYVRNVNNGLLHPGTGARILKDGGSILSFDGGRGYGQRVAAEAMAMAIERCRETGLVMMALRNAHHIGRVGTYGEQSIAAGFVSLHFVNVIDHSPLVAPYGGSDARISTNPLCLAMPATGETPAILLDMATSKIALGKARVAMERGDEVAADTLLDPAGQPTRDPSVMFSNPRGAILPFGDYKGYGLAFFCEMLAGILTGGGTIQPGNERRGGIVNNMLTIIVDPSRLVDHAWMESELDALVRYVKESAPGCKGPVKVAGDPERETAEQRGQQGIPLTDSTWMELLRIGSELGIDLQPCSP